MRQHLLDDGEVEKMDFPELAFDKSQSRRFDGTSSLWGKMEGTRMSYRLLFYFKQHLRSSTSFSDSCLMNKTEY